MVDDDDASGTHQPRRFGRENADRAGPEHEHRVALGDVAHFGALIAGRQGVGQHDGVVVVNVVGNQDGADIGHGHAHQLGLAAVEPAGRVRIAINGAHGAGLGIGVVAVAIQFAVAKKQDPQKILKGVSTRSPTLNEVTDGPTSSMMPVNSRPNVVPTRVSGTRPWYRCRSAPQMHERVTRTMASFGCSMAGSGLWAARTR